MILHKNIFRGQSRRYGDQVNMASEKQPGSWAMGPLLMGPGDFSIIYGKTDGKGFITKTPVYSETVGQFIGIWDNTCWAELSAEEQAATPENEWQGKPIFEDDIVIVGHNDNQEQGIVCWNPDRLWFEVRIPNMPAISFKSLHAGKVKEGHNLWIKVVESCYDSDKYEDLKALRTKNSIRNEFRVWYHDAAEPHWVYGGCQRINEMLGIIMYGSPVWGSEDHSQDNVFSIEKEDLKSLGQWTGLFDDLHDPAPDNLQVGKPIFEDDHLSVKYGKKEFSGTVRYFPEVAAFGIRDSIGNQNLLFATIMQARDKGKSVQISDVHPMHDLRRVLQKRY